MYYSEYIHEKYTEYIHEEEQRMNSAFKFERLNDNELVSSKIWKHYWKTFKKNERLPTKLHRVLLYYRYTPLRLCRDQARHSHQTRIVYFLYYFCIYSNKIGLVAFSQSGGLNQALCRYGHRKFLRWSHFLFLEADLPYGPIDYSQAYNQSRDKVMASPKLLTSTTIECGRHNV